MIAMILNDVNDVGWAWSGVASPCPPLRFAKGGDSSLRSE